MPLREPLTKKEKLLLIILTTHCPTKYSYNFSAQAVRTQSQVLKLPLPRSQAATCSSGSLTFREMKSQDKNHTETCIMGVPSMGCYTTNESQNDLGLQPHRIALVTLQCRMPVFITLLQSYSVLLTKRSSYPWSDRRMPRTWNTTAQLVALTRLC